MFDPKAPLISKQNPLLKVLMSAAKKVTVLCPKKPNCDIY